LKIGPNPANVPSTNVEDVTFGPLWLDIGLWLRVWIAFQRVIAAILLSGFHSGLHFALQQMFGSPMKRVDTLLSAIESILIVALNAALLIEAVRIFLPPPLGVKINLRNRIANTGQA
jgi:hypothetical protein